MPTYEYRCESCGRTFETVQSFADDPLTTCEVCSGALRKVYAPVGIVFKGSGFYKTDSRTSSSKAASKASSESASGSSEGGASDGGTKDGGSKDGGSKDGGSKDGGSKDGGSKDGAAPSTTSSAPPRDGAGKAPAAAAKAPVKTAD